MQKKNMSVLQTGTSVFLHWFEEKKNYIGYFNPFRMMDSLRWYTYICYNMNDVDKMYDIGMVELK